MILLLKLTQRLGESFTSVFSGRYSTTFTPDYAAPDVPSEALRDGDAEPVRDVSEAFILALP